MRVYIKSSAVISPQPTHSITGFPEEINEVISNRLTCIEPEYKSLINPLLLRRMPRILKMGLAASQLSINRAGGINPDGIIVGTGLGCLDNLEKFMMDMLDNHEHVTSVLPFINSTHNAVAAHISMLLKNHNYNTTYCHRGFSFESALQDASMLIHERAAKHMLVGGIDECTSDFVLIHSYLNAWKKPLSNLALLSDRSAGSIAGEGSSFFMISSEPQIGKFNISVEGIHTFLTADKPENIEIINEADEFLNTIGVKIKDIDGVLLGMNGDLHHDKLFYDLLDGYFSAQTAMYYKHMCGEYYTSSAFAVWLGSVLAGHRIPEVILAGPAKHTVINNLLIYNQINNTEHSLIYLNYERL